MKSGFVSIIGRPNVGKSTLINRIVNEHIAITSNKAGTTRNIIQGIYNDSDTQIIFVDTPGIHKPINKLGKILNKQAQSLMKDIDVILFVADAKEGLGKGDKYIIDTLNNKEIPVFLLLNKIDAISKEDLIKCLNDYKDLYPFTEIIPVSALKNDNIEHLIAVLKKYMTDNIRYFDEGTKTSNSIYFMISEFVREKLFWKMEEEIPHSITCATTHYEDKGNIIEIVVDIIVDREPLKKIIIGKNGTVLKNVGIEARKDIERMLGKQVYLELYVKTVKNWRDKEKYLTELGFNDFE